MTEQLTEAQRREQLIEDAAQRVHRYNMHATATLFLEAYRPMVWMSAQALHFVSPVVGVLFPRVDDLAFLMEERGALDRLINRIEELAREADEEQKAARTRADAERKHPRWMIWKR